MLLLPTKMTEAENAADLDIPSCHGCRRRKLKCSREQPSCAHCQRTNELCVYDAKKNKPGLKTGAVEGLSRRLEALEQAFHDRTVQESVNQFDSSAVTSNIAHLTGAVTTLATEIQRLTSSRSSLPDQPAADAAETQHLGGSGDAEWNRPPKRRRVEALQEPSPVVERPRSRDTPSQHLPLSLVEETVHLYFARVFYWIPMIHHPRFREEVKQASGRSRLGAILDAMLVATLRFVDPRKYHLSTDDVRRLIEERRNSVILSAMNSLSIENLQALVIIAFTTIGNGELPRSWPLIASMSRTVDYLQLTVEQKGDRKKRFLAPLHPLSPPADWVEEEERRRVFWNIFNLDRYCSITTGWRTSISGDEINRRLPAHGTYWYTETPVVCPYFGISTCSVSNPGKGGLFGGRLSATDTGNPNIAAAAGPREGSGDSTFTDESLSTTSTGGFSYAVQATEYLNRVATCFLYPDVDIGDQQEVTAWLTRFKELDLQLVHWKMFLPKKWRDPNRAPDTSTGPHDLDHSMTLAHVTHNTSMILLHHRIAYPPSQWRHIVPLPSSCSAETCRLAATKNSNITETWLRVCPGEIVVPPQIAFFHCRYYNEELIPEFWVLVRNLEHMAKRWAGCAADGLRPFLNLAGQYAVHLRRLAERCRKDANFTINVLDYTESMPLEGNDKTNECYPDPGPHQRGLDHSDNRQTSGTAPVHDPRMESAASQQVSTRATGGEEFPILQSVSPPEGPPALARDPRAVPIMADQRGQAGNQPLATVNPGDIQQVPEDLLAISQALMDQRFAEMDRIITLDDSCFEAALGTNMSLPLNEWNTVNMGFANLQGDGSAPIGGWEGR
ncbi:hypothetical protein ACJZ2D_010667 [Fusarium nematophilum]